MIAPQYNLLIKSVNENNTPVEDYLNNISPPANTVLKVNYVKKFKNGNILINCDDNETKKIIEEKVNNEKESEIKFKVLEDEYRKPMIKIVGVSNDIHYNSYSDLENEIKKKKFC